MFAGWLSDMSHRKSVDILDGYKRKERPYGYLVSSSMLGTLSPFCEGETLVSSELSGCTRSRDPILWDLEHLVLCCSPGKFMVGL